MVDLREGFEGDHPRTCGENYRKQIPVSGDTGSPPHLRGKLVFSVHDLGT